MIRCDVRLPGREYSIMIAADALSRSDEFFSGYCKKAAVVSDENVWRLHGQSLEAALNRAGVAYHSVVVPPGEKSKSLDMLKRLCGEFFGFGLTRSDCVVAFGGGVVGDLAGFAAATYMRGVKFIQVPTTLLAQVDSSVGGKVAVNLDEGKNLVGCFYQPCLVLSDTALLSTLPEREWKTGMAEVVKHAVLAGGELLDILEKGPDAVESRLDEVIALNCSCKAGFVERDELDTSARMMLNLGHTFGHALETLHAYQKYNHGEAVAMGMALAARAGTLLGLSQPGTEERLLNLMEAFGLDYSLKDNMADVLPLMAGDKKNSGKDITLVLLRAVGAPFTHGISLKALSDLKGWRR